MVVPWTGPFVNEQSVLRQLVRNAKAGDTAAFQEIVILNQRLVLRVAQRLLLNAEDAKDAAQEVFIRLHHTLHRFDTEQEIGPWLYRLTLNICRDLMRRRKRDVPLESMHRLMNQSPDPEESALAAENYEIVLDALNQLSIREREVIVFRDLEGCSTKEVAELLGSSEATVRSQLSTGRTKLKNYVTARLGRRE
jgi:RNA polymerase sigma-70 factor (ECF subfamily)